MNITAVSHIGHIGHAVHSASSLPGKERLEESHRGEQKSSGRELLISDEGSRLWRQEAISEQPSNEQQSGSENKDSAEQDKQKTFDPNQATSPSGEPLSDSEQKELQELQRRDAEVNAHEQAHLASAGNLAQGPVNFDYETGPDGNRYAVGGDVSIDTSEVPGDPQATLLKAQKIRRAASAPVDPSPQDRAVAAEASRMEVKARMEISEQARTKQQQYIDENSPEVDFFAARVEQNEKDIQDTYTKIQNASVLEQQKYFVDFFI